MNTILLIMKGAELLTTIGPVAIATAVQIRKIFEKSGEDYSVQIKLIKAGGFEDDAKAKKIIDDRLKELEG